jgi:ATP-dependent Clp protease, protease subunit
MSNSNLIMLYGAIGEGKNRPVDIDRAIKAATGDSITAHINSAGGSLFEALAIYNLLKAAPQRIIVVVDALAASGASLVAMAGDVIAMPEGSFMMIHHASLSTEGDFRELAKASEMVKGFSEQMAAIYSGRTGLRFDEVMRLMNEETWMNSSEAIQLGFATCTDTAQMRIAAEASFADTCWATWKGYNKKAKLF